MTDTMEVADQRVKWTEARLATLETLWTAGFSASEIASLLGGVSRNAVCGMVNRKGYAKGPGSVAAASPTISQPPAEPEPLHLTLAQLDETTCKFPHGTGPYTFCGHAKISDGPYCYFHDEQTKPPLQHRKAINTGRAA